MKRNKMPSIKNELELIMEELDDLRKDIEPMSQAELAELDKRVLVNTLKQAANRAENIWHHLYD
jgi:hypothetical protein